MYNKAYNKLLKKLFMELATEYLLVEHFVLEFYYFFYEYYEWTGNSKTQLEIWLVNEIVSIVKLSRAYMRTY